MYKKRFNNILLLLIGIVILKACQKEPKDIGGSTLKDIQKGYIVGGVKLGRDKVESVDDIQWGGNSGIDPSFLVVASDCNEKNLQNCFLADLSTSDLGIYKGLNLADNPKNLYKEVLIRGSLREDILGLKGIDNIYEAALGNKTIESLDAYNPFGLALGGIPSTSLFCNFEDIDALDELTDWECKPIIGSTKWTIENSTAIFEWQKEPVESWLITPLLNIDSNSELYFDCKIVNYSSTTKLGIVFIEVKEGSTICSEISVSDIPATSNSLHKNIDVDLSDFINKKGFIGFKASGFSEEEDCIYEIDNIYFTNRREVLFQERFGTQPLENQIIKINNYTAFDNMNVFHAKNNNADIRYIKNSYLNSNVLFCVLGYENKAYSDEISMDVSNIIPQTGYKNLRLSFDAGTTEDRYGTELNKITIWCDGIKLNTEPSHTLPGTIFKNFSFDIPSNGINKISFEYTENKNINIAIDNITITGEKI